MDGATLDLKALRKAVKGGQIEWKRHALERMIERVVSRTQVLEVLVKGDIIEEYNGPRKLDSLIREFPPYINRAHIGGFRDDPKEAAYSPAQG